MKNKYENNDTKTDIYYAHWLIFKNWIPYKIEDAIEKFWEKVKKILMKESWEYAIKNRKWL